MKKHKISGYMDDLIEPALVGAGMIAAHELKGLDFVKGMALNADGTPNKYYDYLVNGGLIVLGVAAPMLIKDAATKKIVKSAGIGLAVQGLYTLYLLKVKGLNPATINGWNTYALAGSRMGKPGRYALAGHEYPMPPKMPTMGKGAGVGKSGM